MNKAQSETFTNHLKQNHYSTSSITSIQDALNIYIKWLKKENLEIDQIRYPDLLSYMQHLQNQGISQRSIQHYIYSIKQLYQHLENENQIRDNPTQHIEIKGIKRQTLYQVLNPKELDKLYEQCPAEASPTSTRNKVLLGLLIYQCIRSEEISKLTIQSINLRSGKITIAGSKKHNERTLELDPRQVMDLYDYTLRIRPKTQSEILFIRENGKPYNLKNLMTHLMQKVREEHPNIKNAQHLRASVITKWVKQYNLREAQYLAGHRYISSTEKYQKNDLESLQEEVAQYHPLG